MPLALPFYDAAGSSGVPALPLQSFSESSDDKEDSVEEGLRSRRAPRSIEVDGRDVVGASERGLADTPGESV